MVWLVDVNVEAEIKYSKTNERRRRCCNFRGHPEKSGSVAMVAPRRRRTE